MENMSSILFVALGVLIFILILKKSQEGYSPSDSLYDTINPTGILIPRKKDNSENQQRSLNPWVLRNIQRDIQECKKTAFQTNDSCEFGNPQLCAENCEREVLYRYRLLNS